MIIPIANAIFEKNLNIKNFIIIKIIKNPIENFIFKKVDKKFFQ